MKTNPFIMWWRPFVGLAFCLIYPSAALFKKIGYSSLALYGLTALWLLWIAITWLIPHTKTAMSPRRSAMLLLLILFSILAAYLCIHPVIDTAGFSLAGKRFGASDGDNAIDVALTEFLHHRYPYHAQTFLGNPITPMPGALLLALPFYGLGDSAVQNVFWLGAFFFALAAFHRSFTIAGILACLVCFLSPNVLYHVLQGGDYIANSIYIALFSAALLESVRRRTPYWQSALWAIALGIGLSSRLNFILVLPMLYFALARTSTRTQALALSATAAVSFSALTLPFFLYDPAGFSPLHTANKLSLTGLFQWAPFVIPLLGCLLALILSLRRKEPDTPGFLQDVFFVQAFMIVTGGVLASIAVRGVNLEYPHFGVLFMFFGLFVFGPACLSKSGALPNESQKGREPA